MPPLKIEGKYKDNGQSSLCYSCTTRTPLGWVIIIYNLQVKLLSTLFCFFGVRNQIHKNHKKGQPEYKYKKEELVSTLVSIVQFSQRNRAFIPSER